MKRCDKCGCIYLTDFCPVCSENKMLSEVDIKNRLRTPSDLDIPVFLTAPPIIQKIYIENNDFMKEKSEDIEKEFNPDLLMKQWMTVIQTISAEALILTLPPDPTLQDLQFVNSFVYLPHVEEPTIVMSNFKAEGRQPEVDIAEWFLQTSGYKTYRIPEPTWYFEGEPDCKWLRDNIYLVGYGERTTKEALEWIEKKFECDFIYVGRTQNYSYHSDEVFCVLSPTKVMCVIPFCDENELKNLEKVAEIIPIEDEDVGKYCITNNVVVGFTIYAGTYIEGLDPDSDEFKIEMKKLDMLENIAVEHGFDLVIFDISQIDLLGGALSCWFARLNYADRKYLNDWSEYGNK